MKRLIVLFTVLMTAGTTAQGEPLVALTLTNDLVRFTSNNPGGATTVAITGLTAGDQIVGIDVRPFNNVLYGVGTQFAMDGTSTGIARFYSINADTGVATLASTLAADPADVTAPSPTSSLSGSFFGVDFNPVVDRLRVVSDTGQNLRINVATGLAQSDVALAYAGTLPVDPTDDPNFGSPPQVVAAAYTNSFAGAPSTTLLDLDAALSVLADQTMANNGTLNTRGITTSSVFTDSGFDISGTTGIGYVVLDNITLASINIDTGEVTEMGMINTIGAIGGLAVLVPEPASGALVGIALIGLLRFRRRAFPVA